MDDRLCEAIRTRSVLEVLYKGTLRVVEPHGHGITAAGSEVLLVYQRAGESRSGRTEGWKTLRVREIESARPLSIRFLQLRPDADPHAPGLGTVHCFAE